MNRTEFIIATALVLFAAFALGWAASWLFNRLTRGGDEDVGELDRLAQQLHDAEEVRDQAITYLQQREAELIGQIAQVEAELRAAMDGLRDSRREADDLRRALSESADGR